MFSWLSGPEARGKDGVVFNTVSEGLRHLYNKRLQPLEEYYQFHHFHSPALEQADFENKPMVLLIGQYSTGKTTFISLQCGSEGVLHSRLETRGYNPFRDDLIPVVASIILAVLIILVSIALAYQIYKRDEPMSGGKGTRNLAPGEYGIYEDIDYGRVKRLSKISHVSGDLLEMKEYYDDVEGEMAGDIELKVMGGGAGEYYDDVDESEDLNKMAGVYDDVETESGAKQGSYENVPSHCAGPAPEMREPAAGKLLESLQH
ncbi:hypothetical protein scyTo_0015320 [Scyliorhinus torazame]|uniref:EH domain-containing protein n=1 Tax=Scyliorhinus torazame TaxID=75743 RepID=A0A401PQL2_SCYTO|nr:hypothetical protein [Scyliorhinus torazame]